MNCSIVFTIMFKKNTILARIYTKGSVLPDELATICSDRSVDGLIKFLLSIPSNKICSGLKIDIRAINFPKACPWSFVISWKPRNKNFSWFIVIVEIFFVCLCWFVFFSHNWKWHEWKNKLLSYRLNGLWKEDCELLVELHIRIESICEYLSMRPSYAPNQLPGKSLEISVKFYFGKEIVWSWLLSWNDFFFKFVFCSIHFLFLLKFFFFEYIFPDSITNTRKPLCHSNLNMTRNCC